MEIITSKEFIERYGTEKNKEYFSKNKKLINSTKNTILNKLKKSMNIVEIGDGKFNIIEIYKTPKNLILEEIKDDEVYGKLAPIIIQKLINNKMDCDNTLTLSLINFYDFSQSIHKNNYNEIRYKKDLASEELNIQSETILEFYKLINKNLQYKLENCLNLLEKGKLIVWYKIPYLKERTVEILNVCSSLNIDTSISHRRATTEENQFHENLKTELKLKFGITNDKECYFGEKAKLYREEYEKELGKKNIMYFYEGYEVYYKDIEKSKEFINSFCDFNILSYSNKFSTMFIKNVIEDAISRKEKTSANEIVPKNKSYRLEDKYISDYEFLANSTLDFYYKDNIQLGCNQKAEIKGDYYRHQTEIFNS